MLLLIYIFETKIRDMEQESGNISIALIRKLNPAMKGIGNDFIMASTEYYIPDVNSIFKYPLRLDGIIYLWTP